MLLLHFIPIVISIHAFHIFFIQTCFRSYTYIKLYNTINRVKRIGISGNVSIFRAFSMLYIHTYYFLNFIYMGDKLISLLAA